MELVEEGRCRFRIRQRAKMRVPGIVYASPELIPGLSGDRCLEQVVNVAALPGIVTASYAMPDLHLGYGFPIGGVAATDPAAGGVVSPGGVGFDISCGVRLLAASLGREEVLPVLGTLMDQLAAAVPRGAGRAMSRHQALRTVSGPALRRRLEAAGVAVRGASARGLAEETPEAYKNVNAVVEAAEGGGLCRKVARLVPLGVVKG